MDHIASRLKLPKLKRSGVNSPFNDAVDRALDTIGEDKKRFAYWCGRMKGIPPQMISHFAARAKDGDRPAALLSWLIKEYKAQQRLTTKSDDHAHTTSKPAAQ